MWFHSSKEERGEIMSDIVKAKGWSSRSSMRNRSRRGSGNHPGRSIKWIRKNIIKS